MAKKAATRKSTRKKAAKRELIDTRTDKRFVRRGARGQFKESDAVGSLSWWIVARKPSGRRSAGKATEATASYAITPMGPAPMRACK